jgi:hypothetical protein
VVLARAGDLDDGGIYGGHGISKTISVARNWDNGLTDGRTRRLREPLHKGPVTRILPAEQLLTKCYPNPKLTLLRDARGDLQGRW